MTAGTFTNLSAARPAGILNGFSYNFFLLIIFITGLCSLGYQVVWQRYLAVLVGSEARSITIIVAIFLLGLSIGYYLFGQLARKIKSRKYLLKIYGYIELATGIYAALFPEFFQIIFNSHLSHTNNLFIHILLTGLLLFPATILMGATLPVMTAVLPESDENIDLIHFRIYGINTLGAFAGTLWVGFWILPEFGYELSLAILGTINVFASLFYIKNRLKGESYQKDSFENLENNYNPRFLYALGLIVGLTSLSLEILWFRIVALSMGNSIIVFPFVLSIFVLMIGLGSLSIKDISIAKFKKTLIFALIFSLMSLWAIPPLPLVIAHIRVLLVSNEVTFYVFHIVSYLVILCILAPLLFYLGRLLPFVYALVPKNKQNYGQKCGQLYFFNTLGTFLGTTLLGYLAFYLFDLKEIYFITLGLFSLASAYFLKEIKFFWAIILIVIVDCSIMPFPRTYHARGLFLFHERIPDAIDFKKDIIYFNDGPGATVSILESKGKSIHINGKSDGSTFGDYATTTLLALFPYLASSQKQMKASVIGVGTGITAGVLTRLKRISQVDVIEISDAIIDSIEYMSPENFDFHKSPKTSIYRNDAFQFFKTTTNKYDMIIAEPSNPWVVGVENLYTKYFYEMAKLSLQSEGLFVQWMHTYDMSKEILVGVLRNLKSSFKNVTTYITQPGDVIFIASNRNEKMVIKNQNNEADVDRVLKNLGLPLVEDLNFLEIHNSQTIDIINQINPFLSHEIFAPKISRRAHFDLFIGKPYEIINLTGPFWQRIRLEDRSHMLKRLKEIVEQTDCDKRGTYPNYACPNIVSKYKSALNNIQSNNLEKRIKAYFQLRNGGFIKKDVTFIKKAMEDFPRQKKSAGNIHLAQEVMGELLREQEFSLAHAFVERLEGFQFINAKKADDLKSLVNRSRRDYNEISQL